MCFSYRLDNDGESHLTDIAQLLFVRVLSAVSDLTESDRPVQILVLPRFPSRRVIPPGSKSLQEQRKVKVRRIIWMVWLQGWEAAPEIVKACVASWRVLNPGWDIRLLTASDIPKLLGPIETLRAVEGKDLPPEAYSNLVRLGLLRRFGGVWADATTYCIRPLDEWIDDAAVSGFFGFAQPGPDRMLSSWFLTAEAGNPLLTIWERYCTAYWAERSERHIYFWFHGYLFEEAYKNELEFRRVWDATPKISADGPHHFLPYEIGLGRSLNADGLSFFNNDLMPLFKLTHKVDPTGFSEDSAYRFLVERVLVPSRA